MPWPRARPRGAWDRNRDRLHAPSTEAIRERFEALRTRERLVAQREGLNHGREHQGEEERSLKHKACGLGYGLREPSNRLEALKGDRDGQYSIRLNDQWRICFEWPDGQAGPSAVEIVDYH